MLHPELLQDPEFKKKLLSFSSQALDNLLDDLIKSVDDSFIKQCDQFPKAEDLKSLNSTRVGMIKILEGFKTTYLNLNED